MTSAAKPCLSPRRLPSANRSPPTGRIRSTCCRGRTKSRRRRWRTSSRRSSKKDCGRSTSSWCTPATSRPATGWRTPSSSLVAAVRTLPMMAPRRLVIVFHADAMLVPKRESEAASRALEELERLFKNPDPQTTLVLVAGTLDKRSRMYKLLAKQATLVECGSVEDQADAERWIKTRVAAAGAQIEPPAARLLAERCGTDVQRLRNDVDRLLLYTLGQTDRDGGRRAGDCRPEGAAG